MSSAEAEDLIAHTGGLDAFRKAAENALAALPTRWGPGSIYRITVPLWRSFADPHPKQRNERLLMALIVAQRRRNNALIEQLQ